MLKICRICEQFTETSVFILRLHIILSLSSGVPESIIFFENKDFLGDRCEIEVDGCKPMCPGMERKASSLQGNATCAHFYREKNCESYIGPWYAAVGPYEDLKWSIGQDSIVSVGDCSRPMDPINSITFYEDKDYHGKRCNIQMPSKGCQPMCPDLDKEASSAFGSEVGCVKMYNEPNCEGFLGILDLTGPVSEPDFKSTTLQDSISSIGDCSNSSISLYEHKYLGGKRCDMPVQGCQPVCPELVKQASSAQGDAQCVNAYSEANCNGFLGTLTFSDGKPYLDFNNKVVQDSISSIGECVRNNSVIFYEHKKFGGKRCDMQVQQSCQPICPGLDKQASSAQGFIICVHVYANANCTDPLGAMKFSDKTSYLDFSGTSFQDAISSMKAC